MNGKKYHIILHGRCCRRLRDNVDVSTQLVRSYFANNFAHGIKRQYRNNYNCMTCSRAHAKTHARAKGGHRGYNYCAYSVPAAKRGGTEQARTRILYIRLCFLPKK